MQSTRSSCSHLCNRRSFQIGEIIKDFPHCPPRAGCRSLEGEKVETRVTTEAKWRGSHIISKVKSVVHLHASVRFSTLFINFGDNRCSGTRDGDSSLSGARPGIRDWTSRASYLLTFTCNVGVRRFEEQPTDTKMINAGSVCPSGTVSDPRAKTVFHVDDLSPFRRKRYRFWTSHLYNYIISRPRTIHHFSAATNIRSNGGVSICIW